MFVIKMEWPILCVILVIIKAVSTKVALGVTGLPENSCRPPTHNGFQTICEHSFNDTAFGKIPLQCVLTGTLSGDYDMKFGTASKLVLVGARQEMRKISNEVTLAASNQTIECTAARVVGGNQFSVYVHFYYIPPPPLPPTTVTPESTDTITTTTIQDTLTTVNEVTAAQSGSSNVDSDDSYWWLKFVLGGGAVLITLCVVVCCVVYRRRKPPPDDLTYANLTKDQTNYQTLPAAALRTTAPGVALKNGANKQVTIQGTYSEPKDSQDMSEALYADPTRFNVSSDTYAEPYVESAKTPKNDTYAAPYKSDYAEPCLPTPEGNYATIGLSEGNYAAIGSSEGNYAAIGSSVGNYAAIGANSEGNYAQIGKSDNKELYARPIPKAQRPFKEKDESKYSNVFNQQYANTKK